MSRAQDDALVDATNRRRTSARQVRHSARMQMHVLVRDEDALEDAVLPIGCHDVGRRASPKPRTAPKSGARGGFKVWKTPYWKRRSQLWAERNKVERQLY